MCCTVCSCHTSSVRALALVLNAGSSSHMESGVTTAEIEHIMVVLCSTDLRTITRTLVSLFWDTVRTDTLDTVFSVQTIIRITTAE